MANDKAIGSDFQFTDLPKWGLMCLLFVGVSESVLGAQHTFRGDRARSFITRTMGFCCTYEKTINRIFIYLFIPLFLYLLITCVPRNGTRNPNLKERKRERDFHLLAINVPEAENKTSPSTGSGSGYFCRKKREPIIFSDRLRLASFTYCNFIVSRVWCFGPLGFRRSCIFRFYHSMDPSSQRCPRAPLP